MQSNKAISSPINILFTHYGDDGIRSSERYLLDLITHLDKNKFKATLWCNQPRLEKEAQQLGIQVYRSEFPILMGWAAPRFNLGGFFRLITEANKIIKSHQIQLIHANSATPCQWLNFAARHNAIPLLVHLHSGYQLRDRLSLGLYHSTHIVGVSKHVIAPLLDDNMPVQQTKVILNGIDTQKSLSQPSQNIREQFNINHGDFVLVSVGSLLHRKGFDLLIRTIANLQSQEIPAHLIIIGLGPEYRNLCQLRDDLNLQKHVTFIGEVEQVVGLLKGTADLFVSAAREEAFGLVFAEASLVGLSIVAPATGCIPDIVINGHTGTLFPKGNVTALNKAIVQCYFHPQRCIEEGKNGQQWVQQHFSIQRNCLQFENLYQQLLKKPISPSFFTQCRSIYSSLINAYKRRSHKGVIHEI
jgi:glycosyltransferase involved in cell wall biosynthesis